MAFCEHNLAILVDRIPPGQRVGPPTHGEVGMNQYLARSMSARTGRKTARSGSMWDPPAVWDTLGPAGPTDALAPSIHVGGAARAHLLTRANDIPF